MTKTVLSPFSAAPKAHVPGAADRWPCLPPRCHWLCRTADGPLPRRKDLAQFTAARSMTKHGKSTSLVSLGSQMWEKDDEHVGLLMS